MGGYLVNVGFEAGATEDHGLVEAVGVFLCGC